MKNLLLVFVGGGLGSTLRYIIGKYLNSHESGIPWGTFTANILGSFLIGIILGLAAKNDTFSHSQTLLLATGFCGGFTTFSTFSVDTLMLLQQGEWLKGFTNILLNVTVCLLAAAVGINLFKG